MTDLNRSGAAFARTLIAAGKVNKTAPWSWDDAKDGGALLGAKGDDWENYAKHHLGVEPAEANNTKAHWKYPFAKGDMLYRSGLIAVRQRAAAQKATAIEAAAGTLLESIDGKSGDKNSLPDEFERRTFQAEGLAIENRDGNTARLHGHAAVFNQMSEDLGGFREQIAPGAFADALKTDDVRALFNHDPNFVLGRSAAGTLRLNEDNRGLAFEIDLPQTQTVRDLVQAPISRGDVSHMSFGFQVRPGGQDWAKDDDGRTVRTLKRVRLFDISPVTFPAYRQTDVALREWRSFEASLKAPTPFNLLRALQQQAAL